MLDQAEKEIGELEKNQNILYKRHQREAEI